jgi:CubicO group peptidase (beta-lactamase class C family)
MNIRHILQVLCAVMTAISALGCAPSAAVQTSPPPPTQAPSPRIVEGVTFGPEASLLFLTPEQQRVAYRNLKLLAPHNPVPRGKVVSPLPQAAMDLEDFTYNYQDRKRSLDDFLNETRVAGFLVIKDGRIVAERYAHGHGPDSVWTSFSVAKSVLSLLYGAALQDGSIRSLDDSVTKYLPALRGSAYDDVTVRHLLQMSSGVAWNEDETDPQSDLAQTGRVGRTGGIDALLAYMKRLPRQAPAGSVFNYNTGETHIAGALLRAATGKSLAQYLSEKIWQPAGMEADAHWLLMRDGDVEFGGCCLSATLRDYGRLGLLALRGGATADGTRVVAKEWLAASTAPAPTAPNYGYLWWLEGRGRYAASGIFGQYIYVDPETQVVVAIHSLWPVAYNRELPAHRRAFLEALAPAVSGKSRGAQ